MIPRFEAANQISADSERRTLLIAYLIIVLVSFAVYFNALYNDFANDDMYQIVQNKWIKDIKYLPDIFSKGVWGFMKTRSDKIVDNFYRPLMHASFMMDYYIFGLNSWGFHLTSILFHTGVSVLILLLTRRLMEKSGFLVQRPARWHALFVYPPLIAALLFVTHPIHSEAVTWVAGLPEPGFVFFGLLSFYFYIAEDQKKKKVVLSSLFFSLSLLYKETAVTVLLLFAAYDFAFTKDRLNRYSLKRYAPYFIVLGIYFIARVYALGGFAPRQLYSTLTTWQCVINAFPLIVQYIKKLLWPMDLRGYYVFYPIYSIFEIKGIVSCGIILILLLLSILAVKRSRPVFFGLATLVIPLFPVLYVKGIGTNVFTERYLYLPSFGLVFLLALFLARISQRSSRLSVLAVLLCFAAIAGYSAGTVARNPVWKNTYVLYDDNIKKEPAFAKLATASAMIDAYEYLEDREFAQAVNGFRYVIHVNPDYAEAHASLGLAYAKMELTDSAVEELQIAAKLAPNSADIRVNLANALFKSGRIDDAIEQYRTALSLNWRLVEAHYNLAVAYEEKGAAEKAIGHLNAAIELNPANPDLRSELARASALKKR